MVHKGKSPTRKGLPEGRKGCVRAGEHEKATGEHPPAGAPWLMRNSTGLTTRLHSPWPSICIRADHRLHAALPVTP